MKKNYLYKAARFAMVFAVVGASHTGMASEWQKAIYNPSDGSSKGARVTYLYKDDSLFRVNTKLGFVNDIELRPGETVTHIAGGDTKRWLIDKAVVGNVQHVYIKPIEPGIDTNIIINTNQRAYRLYVVASDDYDPLVSFTFPDSPSVNRLRVPEDDMPLHGERVNRNYEIRIKKKADRSLVPLEIFDDGQQTFIRMSKDNKYDLPVLYSIDPWNKKNISMVNYRVHGDYFIADGVFPHGRLFYQQKFSIDFFNLDKKATVKGTLPANPSSVRRARVVEEPEEDDTERLEKAERERERRIEDAKRKEAAALKKEEEKQARIREREGAKLKAEEEKREAERRKVEARLREDARKKQAEKEEALRRQRAMDLERIERQRQIAREQAARRKQSARLEAERQEAIRQQEAARQQYVQQQEVDRQRMEEAQRQEDLRRSRQAEEQMASDAAVTRYAEEGHEAAAVNVVEPENEPGEMDQAGKEKVFWEAVKRQQVYDKMYSEYQRNKKAGEEK